MERTCRGRPEAFPQEFRAGAQVVGCDGEQFTFAKGVPTLRTPSQTFFNPYRHGTLLFDLQSDPEQRTPLLDDSAELRMAPLLVELMRATDAPPSQYERLGLPAGGPVGQEHLLARAQAAQAGESAEPLPRADDYPAGRLTLRTPVKALISDPVAVEVLRRHLPGLVDSELLQVVGATPLIDLVALAGGELSPAGLREVAEELAAL
ncbi:hypothetical protein [Streptomyces durocortorensis]|uniref:Sulfatase n=1 Tax=Streptomyces durocortorensis TaxID=2811104 RepID=A0ABS2HXD8_9ACTN|nr:hypothetical protein [Streptomyces durocortorensis]MBM7054305.1 hypothetical protein [Streptomyces durocortorensis]